MSFPSFLKPKSLSADEAGYNLKVPTLRSGSRFHVGTTNGFTLIELLVVIAIISLLSSVVLASLSTARSKAKDAAIKEEMVAMRAEAELDYRLSDGTYKTGMGGICSASAPGGLNPLLASIIERTANGLADASCGQNTANAFAPYVRPTAWGVAVNLNDGTTFCVDSVGHAGVYTPAANIEIQNNMYSVTSSGNVVCDNNL